MKKIYTLCLMFMMAVLVAGCGATDPNVHITTAALPTAQMAAAYVAPISVRGGLPPYSWTLEQGRWPAGVALDTSSGTVNGAPTETGNFPVTVSVTDSSTPPQSYRHTFSLNVSTGKFEIVTNSLPSGTESVAYSATLTASNGVEPYTWSVREGADWSRTCVSDERTDFRYPNHDRHIPIRSRSKGFQWAYGDCGSEPDGGSDHRQSDNRQSGTCSDPDHHDHAAERRGVCRATAAL